MKTLFEKMTGQKMEHMNPVSGYKNAKKRGGDPLMGALDPADHLKMQPKETGKERAAKLAAIKKKKKKQSAARQAQVYKHGGQVCKGMGAATKGGKFSRNG